MTESIKQWIADQAEPSNFPSVYIAGLTKGIEIAEGFIEWANKRYTWVAENFWDGDDDETFTTSQLLEKYLKTLEP